MDIEFSKYKVYIEIDKRNNVTKIFSSVFEEASKNSILINEGFGDKYAHAQSNYLKKTLFNIDGIAQYKYENGKVVEKTVEEISVEYGKKIQKETVSDLEITFAEYVIENEERLLRLEEKINA